MKKILVFLSENFQCLVVKFSIYLNRHVFVMETFLMGLRKGMFLLFLVHSLIKTSVS